MRKAFSFVCLLLALGTALSPAEDQKPVSNPVIVRATLLKAGEGSKYLWDEIRIVEVVSNPEKVALPRQMVVARPSTLDFPREGVFRLELAPYGESGKWMIQSLRSDK